MQEAQGKFISRGKIKNKDLYYVYPNSFPAVVDGEGEVFGEVYEIEPEKIIKGFFQTTSLQRLDMLERYNPDFPKGSMYLRKRAKCTLENGKEVWVSYYYWNRGKLDHKLLIPSGRYTHSN